MAKVGNPFYECRRLIGSPMVSIRELSEIFEKKVSASHICELENGKEPSLNELKVYHKHFNVTYEYLLGETQNPYIIDYNKSTE